VNGDGTIEGWPYRGPVKPSRLETRYVRAVDQLHKADARMRRAFHAWEKARAAVQRIERRLDQDSAVPPPRPQVVGPDPELNDELPA
jgi:hypothetical protein